MNNITKDTILGLRNGDHASFERVFLSYFNKVKYFINGFVKSESDAEELTQEVFVRIWTSREAIDPERNLNTYIYISARNATMNFLRHKYVRNSFAADQMKAGEDYAFSDGLVITREIDLLVNMALSKMPVQRKTIYEMNRRDGLSNEEIASKLNISKKTVENQMSLALKELKSVVKVFVTMLF